MIISKIYFLTRVKMNCPFFFNFGSGIMSKNSSGMSNVPLQSEIVNQVKFVVIIELLSTNVNPSKCAKMQI